MHDSAKSFIKARHRISTLLLAILAGIAIVVVLGLAVIGLRLYQIGNELDQLREAALPRLVKLAQLSQEASATSSIAPALSMGPTRSEFDTLQSRIRDKENSQRALINELAELFQQPERMDALRRNADLLNSNLTSLTGAVVDQIAVDQRLEAHGENFGHLLRALREGNGETVALAMRAVFQVNNMLLDTNRARFARNRREAEASMEALTTALRALPMDVPSGAGEATSAAHAIADLWSVSGDDILTEKSTQLSNAFHIKALAEENSLIANRLHSSASNEFWRARSELEAQVRLVNQTTRFTLLVILGVVLAFGVGNFLVWLALKKRVFERLDRMRKSLQRYAEDRQQGLSDPRRDEIGEISEAMAHYMGMINQRETELAEKTTVLERLSKQLAKYLSPQVYDSIFTGKGSGTGSISRKNLTIFFSDIEQFTDLTDTLEPERLAAVINLYHSEMSSIAIECGGTLDKFIGDAIMVFFGDPETKGEVADALNALEMALRMKQRIKELQSNWKKLGVPRGFKVRMGITTGYCAVGNLGSEQRLDYSVLGSPVNMAQRLQSLAEPDTVLISEDTFNLVHKYVECVYFDEVIPKGFARPIQIYRVKDFISNKHRQNRPRLSHSGKHIEVSVIDSSDIPAAIEELRRFQQEFEEQM